MLKKNSLIDIGAIASRKKILEHKKTILFLIIYLIFLSAILYFFKFGGPTEDVTIYKGVVKGDQSAFMALSILFSAPTLKEAGVNIVADEVPFFVDAKGNVLEFPYYRQLLMHNIQAAHRNGLQYCMELMVAYLGNDYGRFTIPERVWDTFFPQYNRLVLEYAEFAERNGVEMFAPLVEADGFLGLNILVDEESLRGFEKASDWGQEILHKIKERYSGKVLYRSGITMLGPERPDSEIARWDTFRDNVYINFTGYDYIGFTIVPQWIPNWEYGNPDAEERYRIWLNEVIDYTLMCAERDGCKGVIATEFGEEGVFEEGKGKLSGYFYWFNEPVLYWYGEGLP